MTDDSRIRENAIAPGVIRVVVGVDDVLNRLHQLRFDELTDPGSF